MALNVEMSMPERIRKKLNCVIGFQKLQPNRMMSKFMGAYASFMNGPLASKAIASAIFTEVVSIFWYITLSLLDIQNIFILSLYHYQMYLMIAQIYA